MKKFLTWFKTAGLRSIGYFISGIGLLIFGWSFLSGICLGAFFMDNFVTIKKLIKEKAA